MAGIPFHGDGHSRRMMTPQSSGPAAGVASGEPRIFHGKFFGRTEASRCRHSDLRVWPVQDVLAIFRPMSADEIDFDVDLRELQGQTGVDTLCGFLRAIGLRLGKAVAMTAEGDYGNPVLGFDPVADRVVLLAEPRLS
ncbi:hypothetical protein ACFRAR_17630 [Kitasatospora sp. NPDC056651]|uniref:hypothetical protein n=1 Tax=Kitasatospora sp. NPDC056651 TaxID=3345892 RepID=UPI0036BD1AAA